MNLFRKHEISVNLTVSLSKVDHLGNESIKGTIDLCNNEMITISSITAHIEGFITVCDNQQGFKDDDRKPFYESNSIIALQAKNQKFLQIPQGSHPIRFECPPLNEQVSTSCYFHNKFQIDWEVVAVIHFEKGQSARAGTEIKFHLGRELSTLHAPSSVVLGKQLFLTHKPNNYKCVLHKTSFISGETIAMTLEIKNNSRMRLLSMICELKQFWSLTGKKRVEEFTTLRFEVNGDPFFPLEPKSEIEKMIQFQLPPDLIPSIFINEGTKQLTPLTIDYAFELEFLTEKQDRYKLLVPINIEDNYPPRKAEAAPTAPPVHRETRPSSELPQYNPPPNYGTPEYQNPPAYGSNYQSNPYDQPKNMNTPPAQYASDYTPLYPQLPGMSPYIPPQSYSFERTEVPEYNPAYQN